MLTVWLPCWLLLRPYAGFCKQQLWPLFHYVLPMAPNSAGRFNSELWQAYVKANKVIIMNKNLGFSSGATVVCCRHAAHVVLDLEVAQAAACLPVSGVCVWALLLSSGGGHDQAGNVSMLL
jgi:hypothetical protein